MRKYAATTIVVLLAISPQALAQNATVPNENTCVQRMTDEAVKIHDEYRSVIFGSRQDTDGKFSVLTGGFSTVARKGILEMKGRLTSEFVEPIVESFRVYRCHLASVCSVLNDSLNTPGTGVVRVQPLGCEERPLSRYPECYFAGEPTTNTDVPDADTKLAAVRMLTRCSEMVDDALRSEAAVLRLAVAYDSGYRALLQFAGMMDWMMEAFPQQTVRAIADMVNLLGKLHQIPCFIGQCDAPNTSHLSP